jgi:hypothetical protein
MSFGKFFADVILAGFEFSVSLVIGIFDVNQPFKNILNIIFSYFFDFKTFSEFGTHALNFLTECFFVI